MVKSTECSDDLPAGADGIASISLFKSVPGQDKPRAQFKVDICDADTPEPTHRSSHDVLCPAFTVNDKGSFLIDLTSPEHSEIHFCVQGRGNVDVLKVIAFAKHLLLASSHLLLPKQIPIITLPECFSWIHEWAESNVPTLSLPHLDEDQAEEVPSTVLRRASLQLSPIALKRTSSACVPGPKAWKASGRLDAMLIDGVYADLEEVVHFQISATGIVRCELVGAFYVRVEPVQPGQRIPIISFGLGGGTGLSHVSYCNALLNRHQLPDVFGPLGASFQPETLSAPRAHVLSYSKTHRNVQCPLTITTKTTSQSLSRHSICFKLTNCLPPSFVLRKLCVKIPFEGVDCQPSSSVYPDTRFVREDSDILWTMKKLKGGDSVSFTFDLTGPLDTKKRRVAQITFIIDCMSLSGVRIKFLKIKDPATGGEQRVTKWVRHGVVSGMCEKYYKLEDLKAAR